MINDDSYYGKNPATGKYAWTTTAEFPKATHAELMAATDSDFETGEKSRFYCTGEEYERKAAAYRAETARLHAENLARNPKPATYLIGWLH